jgi:hypothetical protein
MRTKDLTSIFFFQNNPRFVSRFISYSRRINPLQTALVGCLSAMILVHQLPGRRFFLTLILDQRQAVHALEHKPSDTQGEQKKKPRIRRTQPCVLGSNHTELPQPHGQTASLPASLSDNGSLGTFSLFTLLKSPHSTFVFTALSTRSPPVLH